MKFEKGHQKVGGRKKGTPNRVTQTIQEYFDSNGIFIPQKIMELMPKLDERDQVKAWLELIQYVFPKRKSLDHTFNPSNEELKAILKERLDGSGA